MGTYLHTHIITSFRTKADLNEAKSIVADPKLFNVEGEGYYSWTLKPGILNDHLYDLLKIYYNDFYSHDKDYFKQNCIPVLDFLATKPTENEIWDYIEEGTSNVFCISKCKHLRADTIMLTREGKVCMRRSKTIWTFLIT